MVFRVLLIFKECFFMSARSARIKKLAVMAMLVALSIVLVSLVPVSYTHLDVYKRQMCGVKADNIPGWYASQKYRCFRSSNSSVVAHETLLVTQPQYNTRVLSLIHI